MNCLAVFPLSLSSSAIENDFYLEPYINVSVKFQLKKLGVMPPEQPLPVKCNRIYQIMWANHGDAISRQYAGTAALKVRGEQCDLFWWGVIFYLTGFMSHGELIYVTKLAKYSAWFCLGETWDLSIEGYFLSHLVWIGEELGVQAVLSVVLTSFC